MADWDALWINADLATMESPDGGYGAVPDGALAVKGNRIAWVGARADLPGAPDKLAARVHDAGGCWITPGLIDCHTHLVFAGNRAREFEMRLDGASYADIARTGGGIRATVAATRRANEDMLVGQANRRLEALCAEGVTTVEIKSGYGLDTANESKMLRAARRLSDDHKVSVATTFLGAHAVPPEYEGRQGDYVDFVCAEMLPAIAAQGLADAVDAFCETIAFTPEETAHVFETAAKFDLPVKLHADQFSDQGGAALAARFGGLSADHLEYTNEAGVTAMAERGTVAVLLPGAYYFLGETKAPPVAALRAQGVPIAIATDANPGSSPVTSLLLMLNMACTLFGLRPVEALAGVTCNAARALGLAGSRGKLAPDLSADFALWRIEDPAELCYWFGANPCVGVVRGGRVRSLREDCSDFG